MPNKMEITRDSLDADLREVLIYIGRLATPQEYGSTMAQLLLIQELRKMRTK